MNSQAKSLAYSALDDDAPKLVHHRDIHAMLAQINASSAEYVGELGIRKAFE